MEAAGKSRTGLDRARCTLLAAACIAWVVLGIGLSAVRPARATAAPTSLSASSTDVGVDGSSPATLGFPLERTGDPGLDTWVHYETEDGTALAGSDYAAASGELDLPAGAMQGSIPVQALGASAYSPDKWFGLKLLGAAGVGPTPSFGPLERFATGMAEKAVAAADLNGDGRPDLVGTNNGAITVRLDTTVPGSTTTSLAEPATFATDANARGPLAVADLNGDGRPDVIVGNGSVGGGSVSVLLDTTAPGATTPSFAAPQEFSVSEDPESIAVADLNGDGRPDLVVADGGPYETDVSVLLNTTAPGATTPSFAPRQIFLEGENPRSVAVADLNGDGRPDLIITPWADPGGVVSVLLDTTAPGASTVSFAAARSFAAAPNVPWSVAVADVNGDGRPDLVVGNGEVETGGSTVSVLLNITEPGATTPSFAPRRVFAVGQEPRFVAAADLNGDGRPDLVAFNGSENLSVLLDTTVPGATTPSFAPQEEFDSGGGAFQPAIADLNGDGRPDLVTGRSMSVLLNTTAAPTAAAPSFSARSASPAGSTPWSATTADLNGDGRPDVVTVDHGAGAVSVLLDATEPGATAPGFSARQGFPAGVKPDSVATADLNGDGRPDLVAADEGAGTVSVMLNETSPSASSASLAAPVGFAVAGADPSSVTTADVNGDGRPDLIATNSGAGTVSVLLDTTAPGATTPSFAGQQEFATGDTTPESVTTADLNGDGRPDLVVADGGGDTVSVLLNTTAPGATIPSFAAPVGFAVGGLPLSVTTADLNGDGRPDLVVADEGDDDVSVLLDTTAPGATTPSLAVAQAFAAGNAPWSVTTADLNGDGRPDLVVADEGDDDVSVLLDTTAPGAMTTSLGPRQSFAAGSGPVSATTADLNGDGGPDIVAADSSADTVSVLLDTQYAASIAPAEVTGTIHYAISKASLDPSSLAFGGRAVGTDATGTVTLSNEGGAGLAIEGITIAGPGGAQFGEASSCPVTLAVGSGCPITVTYSPGAAGVAAATLTVRTNDPGGPETVALSGTGTGSPPPPPPSTQTLTVKIGGDGAGSVSDGTGAISCPSTCSHAYTDGTRVSLTPTAAPGSRFAGWSGGGCPATGACRLTIGGEETVTADFTKEAAEPEAAVPARLHIRRARRMRRSSGPMIVVTGTIARAARGTVRVRIVPSSGGRVAAAGRARIVDGRWRARLAPAWAGRRSGVRRISVTARFAGTSRVRAGHRGRLLKLR
jgi:hypothetical protein